jgi:tetratricopeptide (TPR) repeat protein
MKLLRTKLRVLRTKLRGRPLTHLPILGIKFFWRKIRSQFLVVYTSTIKNISVEDREAWGAKVLHCGEPKKALKIFQEINLEHPNKPSVALGIANTLACLERFNESLTVLGGLLTLHSDNIQAILMKGQILNALGRREEAIEAFRNALLIMPNNVNALKSIIELSSSDTEKQEFLSKLIQLEPGVQDTWLKYGEYLWNAETQSESKSVQDGSFEDAARTVDRLNDESKSLADEVQLMEQSVALVEVQNRKWARQLAANRHLLGYLDTVNNWSIYENTKIHLRNRSLFAKKYGVHSVYSKDPVLIPESLRDAFTMAGRVPLTESCINGGYPPEYKDIVTDKDIALFQMFSPRPGKATAQNVPVHHLTTRSYVPPMGTTDSWVHELLDTLTLDNGSVAVVSEHNFYYESILLEKTPNVTTIRRNTVDNRSKALKSLTLSEWAAKPTMFDLVIGINVIEHAGLGMYGEEIDPNGDLALMSCLKRMVNPHGKLLLSVPVGLDHLMFNLTRIYGQIRLPLVLEGWDVLKTAGYSDNLLNEAGTDRPVFLLSYKKSS